MHLEGKELEKALLKRAKGGKISCRNALAIAKETGTPPAKVGAMLDDLGIRITNCQLGCFE
ncbi:MAG: hypothetical protein V1934_02110 [Methanobacteriota archaeon]